MKFIESKKILKGNVDAQLQKDVYEADVFTISELTKILEQDNGGINQDDVKRIDQLHVMGFQMSKSVKDFYMDIRERKDAESLKQRIEYYQQTYPTYKFITGETVKAICEKYGLLLASASDYVGDIPVKNQQEIVDFKIKRKDRASNQWHMQGFTIEPVYQYMSDGTRRAISGGTELPEAKADPQEEFVSAADVSIIAPVDKLDVRNREIDGHVLKTKDPIVLQPVEHGYLIVSSWGLEAGDPMVTNSINN